MRLQYVLTRPPQVYGNFELVAPTHQQLFAYTRSLGDITALVLMNFGTSELALADLPQISGLQLALSNYADMVQYPPPTLRGYEGCVYLTSMLN